MLSSLLSIRLHRLPLIINILQVFYLFRQLSKIWTSYSNSTMHTIKPFFWFYSLHASPPAPTSSFSSLSPLLTPNPPAHPPLSEAKNIHPFLKHNSLLGITSCSLGIFLKLCSLLLSDYSKILQIHFKCWARVSSGKDITKVDV